MKRIILWSLSLFLILIVSGLSYIFFKPQVIINPEVLKFGLEKTQVLKKWSWKEAHMDWGYRAWDHRTFEGGFKEFCFDYDHEMVKLSTCLDEISWNVEIIGLTVKTIKPFVIHSSVTKAILAKSKNEEPSSPPDIWKYWTMFWSDLVPDMDVLFKDIDITMADKKEIQLDFKLMKTAKELNASSKDIHLFATPEKIEITPPAKIALPKKIPGMDQLYFRNVKLVAFVKQSGIPMELKGALEPVQFKVNARLDLPVKDDFSSVKFLKDLILTVKANIAIPGIKKNLSYYSPEPFKELPAPLNVMDGLININIETKDLPQKELVEIVGNANINLSSQKQVLDFDITSEVPFNLKTFKPESVMAGLDFKKVQLQLPKLSKRSPPPQFMPDSRFTNRPFNNKPQKVEKPLDVTLHLQALNEKAMRFKTNLLDEVVKLNFDLNIIQGVLKEGFLSVLPLKTKIFKRPIELASFKLTFKHPVEPVIEATINFPLPEYKITLELEGPISKPRYAFSSVPPLPQNDIYAVLLFGRPMADLDPDDKTAAQKTNQLLSQGILSLSVLYFFAGSPVEYVGYDADSKNATAQFGLGNKTSLRVGGGQEGVNSSAIRRSLGKGWYLDTSVQNSSNLNSSDTRNYGVLLERIISY